ncbi:MAG: neutral zinc metallopeptidase [Bacteroidales bacterium]|nr:neutral zinc metallopeptidase [Bacteroidales bacterium]
MKPDISITARVAAATRWYISQYLGKAIEAAKAVLTPEQLSRLNDLAFAKDYMEATAWQSEQEAMADVIKKWDNEFSNNFDNKSVIDGVLELINPLHDFYKMLSLHYGKEEQSGINTKAEKHAQYLWKKFSEDEYKKHGLTPLLLKSHIISGPNLNTFFTLSLNECQKPSHLEWLRINGDSLADGHFPSNSDYIESEQKYVNEISDLDKKAQSVYIDLSKIIVGLMEKENRGFNTPELLTYTDVGFGKNSTTSLDDCYVLGPENRYQILIELAGINNTYDLQLALAHELAHAIQYHYGIFQQLDILYANNDGHLPDNWKRRTENHADCLAGLILKKYLTNDITALEAISWEAAKVGSDYIRIKKRGRTKNNKSIDHGVAQERYEAIKLGFSCEKISSLPDFYSPKYELMPLQDDSPFLQSILQRFPPTSLEMRHIEIANRLKNHQETIKI